MVKKCFEPNLFLLRKKSFKELLQDLNTDMNNGYNSLTEHIRDQQNQFNAYFTVIVDKFRELNKK